MRSPVLVKRLGLAAIGWMMLTASAVAGGLRVSGDQWPKLDAGEIIVTIDPASGDWRQRSNRVLELEWKAAGSPALVVVGDRQARVTTSSR